ncbi:MAG: thiamine-phosphate kinase [Candidatus Cybelea sp.]
MTEDEIVAAIASLACPELVEGSKHDTEKHRRIILGIGDDAALWQPSRSHRSVISTDMLVEGVHFRRDTMSLEDAGWRAMAAALSDLAAMGARPVLATVALGVPAADASAQILELYRGIAAAARRFEVGIAGGDLSRCDLVTISVTVVGEVSNSRAKTRAGGAPGDVLAVTGALGAARAGLELANRPGLMDGANGDAALQAFRRPAPRIAEGHFLAASANVTAMMDCSDGLATDARRLCTASGCGAVLEAIAVADSAREVAQRLGEDPERFALAGGEDFELLVTVRERAFRYLAGRYEKRFKKKLLRVGALRKTRDVEWRGAPLDRLGWDHFA